jgi:hypothetical protein
LKKLQGDIGNRDIGNRDTQSYWALFRQVTGFIEREIEETAKEI